MDRLGVLIVGEVLAPVGLGHPVVGGRFPSLDAAEHICADDRVADVFDGLASLVDKNLVRTEGADDGVPRFTKLQTLREFAHAQLDPDDADRVHGAHAEYFHRQVVNEHSGAARAGWSRPSRETN